MHWHIGNTILITTYRFGIKHVLIIFLVSFILTCGSLVIIPPTGTASAGLSSGFISFATPRLDVVVMLGVTCLCALLRGQSWLILPLAYLLIFMMSGLTTLDSLTYPRISFYIYGAALSFMALCCLIRTKKECMAVIVVSSLAYHLGTSDMQIIPDLADPLYYLLGQSLALILGLAICTSLTVLCSRRAYSSLRMAMG